MQRILFTLIIFLYLSFQVSAQHGKIIENFSLINAINKQKISLSDYKDKKAIAIIFTSNYCPYSKLYEDRILSLHKSFSQKGLQVLLINPNDPQKSANDSIEKMAEKASEKNYPFPYLADKSHTVGKQLGATKTPEVFLLVRKGNGFEIVYNGAIDDNPQVPQDVNESYVSDAVATVLQGKSLSVSSHKPTGCIIKNN